MIEENKEIDNWNIIINLGINDLYNKDEYKKIYSFLENVTWIDYNIYYVSVNPVNEQLFNKISNKEIDDFNNIFLYKNNYIFTKDVVLYDLNTGDGIHYYNDVYINIFNKVMSDIKENNKYIRIKKYNKINNIIFK